MGITRLRADQQVSQSSVTPTELSSSIVGNGLQGAEGTPLSVKNDGSSILVGSSGIKAYGGVVSGSVQIDFDEIKQPGSGEIVSQSGQIALNSLGEKNFSSLASKPTTKAGYGITDDLVSGSSTGTVNADLADLREKNFASLTSKPTLVSGSSQFTATDSVNFLNITASGNISASGFISASSFYGSFVEISSSVVFTSGSSIFGDDENDTHEFTGSATFGHGLAVNGTTDLNGNVEIGDATGDTISFNGRVDTDVIPATNNNKSLGSATNAWDDLHISGTAYIQDLQAAGFSVGGAGGSGNTGVFNVIDATNLYVSGGVLNNVKINQTTKNLVDASISNITTLYVSGGEADGVIIGGTTKAAGGFTTLTATGNTDLQGNVDLGNAAADTISITGVVDTDIIPSADGTKHLGSNSKQWGNLYINGTANIDSGSVDAINVGSNKLIVDSSGVKSLTAGGDLDIGAHGFRSNTLTADGLTSGRVVFAGANGLLTDDSGFNYDTSDNSLTSSKAKIGTADINGGTIDGITSLTAGGNLDIGGYSFTAQTLHSDVGNGTAPFTVASTDKVVNLNADKLDGQEGTYYLTSDNMTYNANTIPTTAINGVLSQWTASGVNLTRNSDVTITGSLTTTGNITSDGVIAKETLLRSFKFGVTASFDGRNNNDFVWAISESIKFGSELIFVNGMLQDSGSSNDYTIAYKTGDANITQISFKYKVPEKHSKIKLMYVPN